MYEVKLEENTECQKKNILLFNILSIALKIISL